MTRNSSKTVGRFLLAAGAAAYLLIAGMNLLADRFEAGYVNDRLSPAVRSFTGDPRLWIAHARTLQSDAGPGDGEKSIEAYQRALVLNPFDPACWNELATAHIMQANSAAAENTVRAGLAAVPNSPRLAWRYANLLILAGQGERAIPYLRVAAASDRSLREGAFHLGWKLLPNGSDVLKRIVPASPEAHADYLHFLTNTGRAAEGYEVWSELRDTRAPEFAQTGTRYVEGLFDQSNTESAVKVWGEILQAAGRTEAKPEGELLTNGDFEEQVFDGGFDWHLEPREGVVVDFDNQNFQHGVQSLRLTFDGNTNPTYQNIWQPVPLSPGRRYRLSVFVRTEDIISDSGVRVCVFSYIAPPAENFAACGKNRIGTEPWTRDDIDFRTGPHTFAVRVLLYRPESHRVNSRIGGRFWVDGMSLKPAD